MLWENSILRQTRIFRFLQYAKGSCTEPDGKLYVALDQKYMTGGVKALVKPQFALPDFKQKTGIK